MAPCVLKWAKTMKHTSIWGSKAFDGHGRRRGRSTWDGAHLSIFARGESIFARGENLMGTEETTEMAVRSEGGS